MTLSFYLCKFIGLRIVTAWIALSLLGISLDLFRAATDIIELGGALRLIEYIALRTPQIMVTLFPIATLLGATTAFLSLGNNLEVIILRASGSSFFIILRKLLPLTILLGLFYSQAGDRINSWTSENLALSFPETKEKAPVGSTIWARDGNNIIKATLANEDGTRLDDLAIYEADEKGHVKARVNAERADFENGKWLFSNALKISPFSTQEEQPQVWSTLLTPENVRKIASNTVDVSAKDARAALAGSSVATRSTSYYTTRIARTYSAIFLPFVLCMIAALAGFGGTRNDSGLRLAIYAVVIGFLYVVFDGMFGSLGESGVLPAYVAALTPTALFAIGSLWGLIIVDG